MKTLHFEYRMEISYSKPVNMCHFKLKCLPGSDARQQIRDMTYEITPEAMYSTGSDSFGNRHIYGSIRTAHDRFLFQVKGEAEIGQILYEEEEKPAQTCLFRHPYGKNKAGQCIRSYYESLPLAETENVYEKSLLVMHRLHRDFAYQPGVTGVSTTAEEAMHLGKGVCQDYAHIFISLLHLAGIPARYVTGLMAGEGASHAWVEILYHKKWIGMDPTNDLTVNGDYVKIGHGRDAGDCMLNQGLISGGGIQIQKIETLVKEI